MVIFQMHIGICKKCTIALAFFISHVDVVGALLPHTEYVQIDSSNPILGCRMNEKNLKLTNSKMS